MMCTLSPHIFASDTNPNTALSTNKATTKCLQEKNDKYKKVQEIGKGSYGSVYKIKINRDYNQD